MIQERMLREQSMGTMDFWDDYANRKTHQEM
jgi:hypothetical protein